MEGLLRTERTPMDARFTNQDLARNFLRIALFREYRRDENGLIEERTPTRLSRWEQPVRYQIVVMFMLMAAVAITGTAVATWYRSTFFTAAQQLR